MQHEIPGGVLLERLDAEVRTKKRGRHREPKPPMPTRLVIV